MKCTDEVYVQLQLSHFLCNRSKTVPSTACRKKRVQHGKIKIHSKNSQQQRIIFAHPLHIQNDSSRLMYVVYRERRFVECLLILIYSQSHLYVYFIRISLLTGLALYVTFFSFSFSGLMFLPCLWDLSPVLSTISLSRVWLNAIVCILLTHGFGDLLI